MSARAVRLSLSDLSAAGIRLRPTEAVTVVRELSLQVSRGLIPGVPSAHVIRFSSEGAVGIEGPVAAGGRPVARAAQLLESLLPGFDAPRELRAPGPLRLVIARALGTLDLPPYASLEGFADALGRFAAPDTAEAIAGLVSSAALAAPVREQPAEAAAVDAAPVEPQPGALVAQRERPALDDLAAGSALTISDIRRARRATGLTLSEIAARSRIPAPLLRELEWGYFRNWPAGHYGRTQLLRYARAAGLDDELVVSTVWPLLEEMAGQRSTALVPATKPIEPVGVAEGEIVDAAPEPSSAPAPRAPRFRWQAVATALAIPALLAIALLPAFWEYTLRNTPLLPAITGRSASPGPPPAPGIVQGGASETPPPAKLARPGTKNTGAPRPVDGPPADEVAYSPAFATTGSAMFYHAESDGSSSLMRADTDSGGAILKITSVSDGRANNFHARPSPDGTRIAFDSDRDGVRAVYVADATGRNVRKVSGDGFAAVPSWSPDGRRLAFVRAEPGKPQVWNLWTADLESGQAERLTSHADGQPWGGSWFPDGRRIAYSHGDNLIVLNVETGAKRAYSSPKAGQLLRTPTVSPDGRRIIFQIHRDGAWLLDLKDGSMRKVLTDPSAEQYTWAPDGRRVAYHSRQSGEWGVWLMSAR